MTQTAEQNISDLITSFMEQPASIKRTMRQALYEDVPDALGTMVGFCRAEFIKAAQKLAEVSGDTSIAELKIEDGSMHERYEALRKVYAGRLLGNPPWDYFSDLEIPKQGYEASKDWKLFFEDDLLPVLHALEEGAIPTPYHQRTLRLASQKVEVGEPDFSIGSICNQANKHLPLRLHIRGKECDSMDAFAKTVYNRIEKAVTTRLQKTFLEERGRSA